MFFGAYIDMVAAKKNREARWRSSFPNITEIPDPLRQFGDEAEWFEALAALLSSPLRRAPLRRAKGSLHSNRALAWPGLESRRDRGDSSHGGSN